jgi:hypothetical protein
MRSLFLAFALLLASSPLIAQSLLELNQSELNIELKKSLDKEDYDRATKIQKELRIHRSLDSLKNELNIGLKEYLGQENYLKSAEVQSKIEKCVRLENLPKEIKKALEQSNFQQAQSLVSETHTLRFDLLGIPNPNVKNTTEVKITEVNKQENTPTSTPSESSVKASGSRKHKFCFYTGLMITLPKVIIDDTLEAFTGFKSRAAAGISFAIPLGQTGLRILAGSDVKSFRTVITNDKYPGLIIGEEISKSWQFAYHFGIDYSIVVNNVIISPGVIIDKGVAFQGDFSNSSITSSKPINYYGPNIIGEPGLNYEKTNVQPQITIQYNKKNVGVYAKYRHGTSILNPEPDVSKSRFYLSCLELGITIKRK